MSVNGQIYSDKYDQLELVLPGVNSNSEEENQSDRFCRSVLKESRFKANNASRRLFDSCASQLTVSSLPSASQKSDSKSCLLERQVHIGNDYSCFTKKIESTPISFLPLPPPKNDRLTTRLSDQEFNKRKELCRREKSVVNFFAGSRSLQTPCLSHKEGMSDEQKEEFNKHIQNVNQEIHFRVATAPLAVLGASSRKAAEVVTQSVSDSVERFCSQNPMNQMICARVGDLSTSVFKEGIDLIPDVIKQTVQRGFKEYHGYVESKADEYALKYRIDKQDTRDIYSGALTVSANTLFVGAKISTQLLKNRLLITRRIPYSEGYNRSVDCFVKAKEFQGVLSKDLMVVQYHSGTTINQGRSLKWFTPIAQANKLPTVDQVMDKLALLSSWGERTYVTIAKIPAGERVKFLHGRAIGQISKDSLELVKGGGVQYRFYDFDPKWILETKKLPK